MQHEAAFENLVHDLSDLKRRALRREKIVFVCKQGRDRSVFMARALMQVLGISAEAACADMRGVAFVCTLSCK